MVFRAADAKDVAVQLDDVRCARARVEVVDVLRDDDRVGEARDGLVRRVRLRLADQIAARFVPLPDEEWIAAEGFGCREVFGAEVSPEAVRVAEGRDAAVGRDARAGEDDDTARLAALNGEDGFIEAAHAQQHRVRMSRDPTESTDSGDPGRSEGNVSCAVGYCV